MGRLIASRPLFWIVAVQMAWAMMLVFWILAYVLPQAGRAAPAPGLFGWGLVFLALMIFGGGSMAS